MRSNIGSPTPHCENVSTPDCLNRQTEGLIVGKSAAELSPCVSKGIKYFTVLYSVSLVLTPNDVDKMSNRAYALPESVIFHIFFYSEVSGMEIHFEATFGNMVIVRD